jgi:hypothetical protein
MIELKRIEGALNGYPFAPLAAAAANNADGTATRQNGGSYTK